MRASLRVCAAGGRVVVVGMSGGVDSSVAAWLLQRQGHTVKGLFVQSWDSRDETGTCAIEEEWEQVQRVCEHLGIANCVRHSLVSEYWMDVFEPMIASYRGGLTPNPDVECNRRIKFDCMARFAFRDMGADVFATGHYARVDFNEVTGVTRLLRSPAKCDQTLFLSRVSGEQLRRVVFPLGSFTKDEVRAFARQAGLDNAERPSSTGICFVGERPFGSFLQEYVDLTPGAFVMVDSGKVVGEHDGAQRFTVGQRARIGGATMPLFVVATNAESGQVIVAPQHHPSRFGRLLSLASLNWISGKEPLLLSSDLHVQ